MIKPIATLAIAAFTIAAFAQSQTVKIKSRGEDVRTVIDAIFEQTGKQYVLETNFHQTLYMNLDGVSFQKAIEIISSVTDMEFEEKQGIWYIHKKPISIHHIFAPTKVVPITKDSQPKVVNPTPALIKTKAPAKSTTTDKSKSATQSTPDPKSETAGQSFAALIKPNGGKAPRVNMTRSITVQLKKMDIREVFAEFGRQGNVDIEFDEAVPNYKLDASFYNTTLKFALDKVCKVAKLKYTVTTKNTLRISKI